MESEMKTPQNDLITRLKFRAENSTFRPRPIDMKKRHFGTHAADSSKQTARTRHIASFPILVAHTLVSSLISQAQPIPYVPRCLSSITSFKHQFQQLPLFLRYSFEIPPHTVPPTSFPSASA